MSHPPLYREARAWLRQLGPRRCPDQAHAGLWFERFYGGFNSTDWSVPRPHQDGSNDVKRDWIDSVSGSVGNGPAIDAMAERRAKLIAARGGDFRCLRTDWHFVTGVGQPHPVENGFAWHPTLGVPYLSGAAVKGLLRAFLEAWQDPVDKDRIARWFGSKHKDDLPERVGELVFFDALPVHPPKLGRDIMTPHMDKWYEAGDQRPLARDVTPGDWHSPVPVPFLVVEDARLLFGIAPRRLYSDKDSASAEVAEALEKLVEALDWLGAGAKTAAGYGHMVPDKQSEDRLRHTLDQAHQEQAEAEAMEKMTPAQQSVEAFLKTQPDNPAVALLQAIEAGQFRDTETILAAAKKAQLLMLEAGEWRPDFTGTNKSKCKQRDRSRKIRDLIIQHGGEV